MHVSREMLLATKLPPRQLSCTCMYTYTHACSHQFKYTNINICMYMYIEQTLLLCRQSSWWFTTNPPYIWNTLYVTTYTLQIHVHIPTCILSPMHSVCACTQCTCICGAVCGLWWMNTTVQACLLCTCIYV